MNLNEIEYALKELKSRHPNLNEALLITLLQAGGWDDRAIKDAIAIYRTGGHMREEAKESKRNDVLLPKLEEQFLFPEEIATNHLLVDHNKVQPVVEVPSLEPQSMISPGIPEVKQVELDKHKDEEIPHNLPLRPFETAPHIWEFSRYREIFHGDVMPKNKEEPKKIEVKKEKEPEKEPEIKEVKEVEVIAPKEIPKEVELPREVPRVDIIKPKVEVKECPPVKNVTGLKSEERLVIIAFIMLLLILLILGYMYSNGRL